MDVGRGDLQARFGERLRFGHDWASQLATKHSSALAQQAKGARWDSGNFDFSGCCEFANLFGRDDVTEPFDLG